MYRLVNVPVPDVSIGRKHERANSDKMPNPGAVRRTYRTATHRSHVKQRAFLEYSGRSVLQRIWTAAVLEGHDLTRSVKTRVGRYRCLGVSACPLYGASKRTLLTRRIGYVIQFRSVRLTFGVRSHVYRITRYARKDTHIDHAPLADK